MPCGHAVGGKSRSGIWSPRALGKETLLTARGARAGAAGIYQPLSFRSSQLRGGDSCPYSDGCCGVLRISTCGHHAWLVASAMWVPAVVIASILRKHESAAEAGGEDGRSSVLRALGGPVSYPLRLPH